MKKTYKDIGYNKANYVPLTPISFLHRTADIYGEREAIIYGGKSYNWRQCRERCIRIASSLAKSGIGLGDTVAVLAFNTPEMFESHFAVPMTGAVLNTINTRLEADTVAYILEFGNAKALIIDRELFPLVEKALAKIDLKPVLILIDDETAEVKPSVDLDVIDYEDLVKSGDPDFSFPHRSIQASEDSMSKAIRFLLNVL